MSASASLTTPCTFLPCTGRTSSQGRSLRPLAASTPEQRPLKPTQTAAPVARSACCSIEGAQMVLLTFLSAVLVLVFFGVLAYALVKISGTLESIGGTPTSYLAKLRLGLRAIEKETSHLGPQVLQVNGGLKQIA